MKNKNSTIKKTNSNLISISLVLLILSLTLPLIQAPSETEFNSENIYSWKENPEEVLNLNSDERNPIINNANPGIRATIIKEMTIELSEQKYFARLKVNNALSKLTGVTDAGISIQDVKGFENPEIQFTKDNLLSDGNIEIDLDNIPINTKEIEYIPAKAGQSSKLIYTFKDNSKITIESGSIDQEHNYINQEQNIGLEETQRKVRLFPGETGTIETDGQEFKLSQDAKVQIGDRTFQAKEGTQGTLKIEEGSHFKASNLKITTPSLNIETPETLTDIIFKTGDYSNLEQYIQIYEQGDVGMDGPNQKFKYTKIKGKDITLELKEDIQGIFAKGENIIVKDSEGEVLMDNEKTYVPRRAQRQIQKNTQIKNTNEGSENNDVEIKGSNKLSTNSDFKEFVRVGKYIEGATRTKIIGGKVVTASGRTMDEIKQILGTELGQNEPVKFAEQVAEISVYTIKGEKEELMQELINQPKKLNAEEFGKYISDNNKLGTRRLETKVVHKKVEMKDVMKKLETEFNYRGSTDLTPTQKQDIKKYIKLVESTGKKIPMSTEVITESFEGTNENARGIFRLNIPGKNLNPIVLQGPFIYKYLNKQSCENSYQTCLLYSEYLREWGRINK